MLTVSAGCDYTVFNRTDLGESIVVSGVTELKVQVSKENR